MAERHSLNRDPYAKPSKEEDYGTKHPRRFESQTSTIESTQPQQRIRALVYSAASPSLGAGPTAITFDTKVFDTAGIWTTTKLTIPSTGKITGAWLLTGQITWPSSAAGTKRLTQIRKNGATVLATAEMAPVAQIQSQDITVLVNDPNAGDFFELVETQDSGGNLTIVGGQDKTYFEIIHLW